jgi:protein involved in polysaccharide export with SLBB domain
MMTITNTRLATGLLVAAALGVLAIGYQSWVAGQSTDRTNPIKQSSNVPGAAQSETHVNPIQHASDAPASSQGKLRSISLLAMRRSPIDVYRLGPGDTLGLVIDEILGNTQQIPVRPGETPEAPSSLGFPVPVREDGTISMPQVPPIQVQGMSISEVEKALRDAYTIHRKIVSPDKYSAIVTLARRRTAKVLVVRQDKKTGQLLELPIGENDLITALVKTGGVPLADGTNELVIERTRPVAASSTGARERTPAETTAKQKIPIPLMWPADKPAPFTEDDITLQSGDVVFVASHAGSK